METVSKNEMAETIMGKRELPANAIIFDQPCELGYHCPVCEYNHTFNGNYDERLEWSEYNGFIWCRVCNFDFPSYLCIPDKKQAVETYLLTVHQAQVMAGYLYKVGQFHERFNHPNLESPKIPDQSRCNLRVSLLEEELKELKTAIQKGDIVEVADALCDLQYVLSGAVLEFGLGSKFNDLFNEVHRSNMSKICTSKEEAEKTVEHYKAQGVESYIRGRDNVYLVYRKSDNKTLKSINYSPANLKNLL